MENNLTDCLIVYACFEVEVHCMKWGHICFRRINYIQPHSRKINMYECVLPKVESTSQKSQRNRKEQSIIYLFEEMVYGETEAEKLFTVL